MNHSIRILLIPVLLIGLTLCFTSCKPKPALPVVTTASITGITQLTATSGGNVTDDGNVEVTARGVCWSTSQNPTTSSGKTSDGTGTGIFNSSITGLIPGTTYYVRAYATNSEGTAYGSEVSFSSNPVLLATLTTTTASSITQTTAVSGGNITSDGGGAITARGVCWGTATAPLATGLHTTETGTTGTFTSNLTGLTANTKYYFRAYAINSAGAAYGDEKFFTTEPVKTVTDIDGNVYNTVTIGTQVWMVENLKTTKYNDGAAIPNVTDYTWGDLQTDAYCWYNNDISNKATFGALYNWFAAKSGKLCPADWHVATLSDWTTLVTYLGGIDVAGGKLKEAGNAHWLDQNVGATNESGFTALPGGYRGSGLGDGTFFAIGYYGWYWTATVYPMDPVLGHIAGYNWQMTSGYNNCLQSNLWDMNGLSVRCIKD
jgi:uncharacterized protein (TIGR02145 family)